MPGAFEAAGRASEVALELSALTWHAAAVDAPHEVLGHVVVDDDAALRLENHVQRLEGESEDGWVRIL